MTPSLSSIEKSVNKTSQQQSSEAINFGFDASATTSNQSAQAIQSPLDRRATERSENLKLLKVQVKSAKSHLQGSKKPWKIYEMFMRGKEKCVLFVIRQATVM